jgi:hypothetical protein
MDSNATSPQSAPLISIPAPVKKKRKIWLIVLIVLVVFFLLLVGGIAALFYGVKKAMANSDAYKISITDAHASACVAAKLGEPFVATGLPSGSINENNGSGSADLTVPLKGPLGTATLHTIAMREAGVWSITTLTVNPASGSEIQVLPVPSPCQ